MHDPVGQWTVPAPVGPAATPSRTAPRTLSFRRYPTQGPGRRTAPARLPATRPCAPSGGWAARSEDEGERASDLQTLRAAAPSQGTLAREPRNRGPGSMRRVDHTGSSQIAWTIRPSRSERRAALSCLVVTAERHPNRPSVPKGRTGSLAPSEPGGRGDGSEPRIGRRLDAACYRKCHPRLVEQRDGGQPAGTDGSIGSTVLRPPSTSRSGRRARRRSNATDVDESPPGAKGPFIGK